MSLARDCVTWPAVLWRRPRKKSTQQSSGCFTGEHMQTSMVVLYRLVQSVTSGIPKRSLMVHIILAFPMRLPACPVFGNSIMVLCSKFSLLSPAFPQGNSILWCYSEDPRAGGSDRYHVSWHLSFISVCVSAGSCRHQRKHCGHYTKSKTPNDCCRHVSGTTVIFFHLDFEHNNYKNRLLKHCEMHLCSFPGFICLIGWMMLSIR